MKKRILNLSLLLFSFVLFGQINIAKHKISINQQITINPSHDIIDYIDLDNDGDLDFVFIENNSLYYLKRLNTGNFEVKTLISTQLDNEQVSDFNFNDMDDDGDIDIIMTISSPTNSRLIWVENDGLANFNNTHLIDVFTDQIYGSIIKVNDINGDNKNDIIVYLDTVTANIYWYETTTLGTSSRQIIVENITSKRSFSFGDIDGDNDLDILLSDFENNAINWMLNDGTGNFNALVDLPFTTNNVYYANFADIDNDGDLDITCSLSDGVYWFENTDGQTTFSTEQLIVNTGSTSVVYRANDIDMDGDIDIVYNGSWIENADGQGNFTNIINYSTDNVGYYVFDFDGDSDNDILSSTQFNLVFYENNDSLGNFSDAQLLTAHQDLLSDINKGDIDNDGDLDIIVASSGNTSELLAWYENDGTGYFFQRHVIANTGSIFGELADLDNDGDLDAYARMATYGVEDFQWYKNTNGHFTLQQVIAPDVMNAKTIDVDNDGDLDMVFNSSNQLFWSENIDGNGAFGTPIIIKDNEFGIQKITVLDIDGDNDLDFVYSVNFSTIHKIIWQENTGNGGSWTEHIIEEPADLDKLVDIDNDNDMDIVFELNNKLYWKENTNGQGSFGTSQLLIDEDIKKSYFVDFDSDGDMDLFGLAVHSNSPISKMLVYYEHINTGNFGTQQIISTSPFIIDSYNVEDKIISGDFNGDLKTDISVSTNGSSGVWFENLGNGSANQIYGKLVYDTNNDGCDMYDTPVSNVMVTTDDGASSQSMLSMHNGYYQFFAEIGNYETSVVNLPSYFSFAPATYNTNFVDTGNAEEANFCISSTVNVNDLNISILPLQETRPGLPTKYRLVFENIGTERVNGTINFQYDNTRLQVINTSETPITTTSNTLDFSFVNLNVFETRTIDITFQVAAPPIANLGDVLIFEATINPLSDDFTPNDNHYILNDEIIDSRDPNEIRVLEGTQMAYENKDEYLHYIIYFQNEGTASAIKIKIENVLDDKLDWQTFQLETASHQVATTINNGNLLSFEFNGIYLPDSTTDEPNSHGYVAYKIKPKSTVSVGDIFTNQADIYFDFNAAIITNAVATEIVNTLDLNDNNIFNFTIYPVPTSDLLKINTKSQINSIEVYNSLGQLVSEENNINSINIASLIQGLYFVKVTDKNNNSSTKKIVKK